MWDVSRTFSFKLLLAKHCWWGNETTKTGNRRPEGRQKGDAERRAGESFPPSPGGAGGSGALAPQMKKPPGEGGLSFGVRCGARTHDTQNHNLVLYQLN